MGLCSLRRKNIEPVFLGARGMYLTGNLFWAYAKKGKGISRGRREKVSRRKQYDERYGSLARWSSLNKGGKRGPSF